MALPDTTDDRIVRLLAWTPPFDRLNQADRRALLDDLLVAYYETGHVILEHGHREHDHLFVVVSGRVTLRDPASGRLFDECGEGDVFGGLGLMESGPLPYEARAQEPTVCALLPASHFHRLCDVEPAFAAFFERNLQHFHHALPPPTDTSGSRLLFQTRLEELVRRPPVTCAPGTPAREAARIMQREHVGSILVTDDRRPLGILTNTDLRDEIVIGGAAPEAPVEQLMSRPVISLSADALVFEALMTMLRHRMHHLVVTKTDAADAPARGVISDQDIARAHGYNPASLVRRIEQTSSLDVLTSVRAEMDGHLLTLFRQGVRGEDLLAINTEVNDRLSVRVLQLVEERLRAEEPDRVVETPWVWMSLGSEGRREMGVKTDQDNAIIYADPSDDEEATRAEDWFGRLAEEANQALAACGFTLCPGEVMAMNPRWRQPLHRWKRTFRSWIITPAESAVMHASIFFDLRALYGDFSLVDALKADLANALDHEPGFLAFLMHDALSVRPPLSFFRRFVLERSGEHTGTFDVKRRGLMPLVDLGRILALGDGYLTSTSTFDRLRHARDTMPRLAHSAVEALDAYRFLVDLRLEHHLRAVEERCMPDNHIDPSALSKLQQHMLKATFSTIADLQDVMAHRYGAEMMRR